MPAIGMGNAATWLSCTIDGRKVYGRTAQELSDRIAIVRRGGAITGPQPPWLTPQRRKQGNVIAVVTAPPADAAIGGEDEPGGPNAGEAPGENPYPEPTGQPLHDGCRSTHGLHHVTLCRKCNKIIPDESCNCKHRDYESRVVTMAKEPWRSAKCWKPPATADRLTHRARAAT